MAERETLNQQIFFGCLGLFFSLPSEGEIFLEYLAPVFLKDPNPAIHLAVTLIMILVLISSISWLIVIITKTYRMRGILTNNHGIRMLISAFLGAITGMFLKGIVF